MRLSKFILIALVLIFCFAGSDDYYQQDTGATGPVGGSPNFGGTVQAWATGNVNDASTAITLTSGIAQGTTVVVFANWYAQSADVTIGSLADDRSNTYGTPVQVNYNTYGNVGVAHAYVGTALQIGDNITITWSGATTYTYRSGYIYYTTDCASAAQPDQSATGSAYGTSPTASASTTAANTILIGAVQWFDPAKTYGSGNWTNIGTYDDHPGGTLRTLYVQKQVSSAGSQDPGGTISASTDWGVAWVALK